MSLFISCFPIQSFSFIKNDTKNEKKIVFLVATQKKQKTVSTSKAFVFFDDEDIFLFAFLIIMNSYCK